MNEASPQYNAVLNKLQVLTKSLQHGMGVEVLLQKFKMQKWIATEATATANELVLLALNRIQNQVTDYDVFIRMLKSMPGVNVIADQMTGILTCLCNCECMDSDLMCQNAKYWTSQHFEDTSL